MPTLAQWQETWKQLGAAADERLFHDLVARYREPQRRYHTLRHLEECFDKLRDLRALAVRPAEVEPALWFHDAIYDARRSDNEQRSVEWARTSALAQHLSAGAAVRVYALVVATRHEAVPRRTDAKIQVDVDLSILGAPMARFDEYERQLRDEYPGCRCRRSSRRDGKSSPGCWRACEFFRPRPFSRVISDRRTPTLHAR